MALGKGSYENINTIGKKLPVEKRRNRGGKSVQRRTASLAVSAAAVDSIHGVGYSIQHRNPVIIIITSLIDWVSDACGLSGSKALETTRTSENAWF